MTREILITPVLNGWVCRVGCQTVAFTNLDLMINNLRAYYMDPHGVEKQFVAGAVNKTMDCEPPRCPEVNMGGSICSEPGGVPSRPVELRR